MHGTRGRERRDSDLEGRLVELLGHELWAPVSALQNSAELLIDYLDGDLASAEAQAEVRRIHRLSLRLGMMIQDLYEMARISSGAWEIALVEIDPLEVVTSAIDIARTLPGMPAIATDTVAERLTVPGDVRRLSGAVLNLLTNAAKHAPQTERIDVRIRSNDQNLMIDIEDYGPGIPPDDLPRIFNRYFQSRHDGRSGSRSSARHSDGLGLGLFVAQQIVQAHHGQITVTSEVGSGTRFTIQLPRS
jgi:two-component system, OmpR family, sensor kinase